jgi:hypothetical protein
MPSQFFVLTPEGGTKLVTVDAGDGEAAQSQLYDLLEEAGIEPVRIRHKRPGVEYPSGMAVWDNPSPSHLPARMHDQEKSYSPALKQTGGYSYEPEENECGDGEVKIGREQFFSDMTDMGVPRETAEAFFKMSEEDTCMSKESYENQLNAIREKFAAPQLTKKSE